MLSKKSAPKSAISPSVPTVISKKRKNVSRGRERSVSESEERRALMLPQELKAMSQDKEIILYEGMSHPAQVGKIRYYQDGTFTKRLMEAVKVASLKGKR